MCEWKGQGDGFSPQIVGVKGEGDVFSRRWWVKGEGDVFPADVFLREIEGSKFVCGIFLGCFQARYADHVHVKSA